MWGITVEGATRLATLVAGVAIAILLWFPRVLHSANAAQVRGGCGSGFCTGEHSNPCVYVGDGCGSYNQCQSASNGEFICTPATYCSAAGCSTVQGGSCY